jgi:hypothetical protein
MKKTFKHTARGKGKRQTGEGKIKNVKCKNEDSNFCDTFVFAFLILPF